MTEGPYALAPLVTVNADFTDGPHGSLDNVLAVLPGAVIAFVQEAKRIRFRDRLTRLFGVRQGRTEAKAGSALLWDRSRCKVIRAGQVLAARPEPGDALLPRWLAWADLRIDGSLEIRAIAGHRPLKSTGDQLEFDIALEQLIDSSFLPCIVGLDTNSPNPAALAGSMGLLWRGFGIDGFMYDRGLSLSRALPLRRTRSDHRAVMSQLDVPLEGRRLA